MRVRCDKMLWMKGSAEHSRCTCVDRPSRSSDEQVYNHAPHRKCLRKKTTACVSLFVLLTIRRDTFPYSIIEDGASTTSQTSTTHYTNTCVKLTIVTHLLSFSKRIAIANLSYFMRGHSLVKWEEHDNSAADIMVHSMYKYVLLNFHK